jgi:hypothetical protein
MAKKTAEQPEAAQARETAERKRCPACRASRMHSDAEWSEYHPGPPAEVETEPGK